MEKVSNESIKKHTKKDWATWIEILNRKGGSNLSHSDLVSVLRREFKLSSWWQQTVAREYHISVGVRLPQQTLKGTYTTTVTKSFTSSAQKLFSYIVSSKGQMKWLRPLYTIKIKALQNFECEDSVFGDFRTVNKNRRLRLTWINEEWPQKTVVQINLYPKPGGRTMIVIDHLDLPSMKTKKQMHDYWRNAIEAIACDNS